jgi:hypothetical protein
MVGGGSLDRIVRDRDRLDGVNHLKESVVDIAEGRKQGHRPCTREPGSIGRESRWGSRGSGSAGDQQIQIR